MDFTDWLIKKKNLNPRSAKDVKSRLNRISRCNEKFYSLGESSLKLLIENEAASPSVRSQLKRAINLYKEFKKPS